MAKYMYKLTLEDPRPTYIIKQFQLGVRNIIIAMGEQRESILPHLAFLVQHLPTPTYNNCNFLS